MKLDIVGYGAGTAAACVALLSQCSGSWARPGQGRKRILPFLVTASAMIRWTQSGIQERSTVARIIAGATQKTGRGESTLSPQVRGGLGPDIQKNIPHIPRLGISDSLRVNSLEWDVVKGRTGVRRAGGPPPEGERPFTATNKPACHAQQRLDGAPRRALPHSIPLGHTSHDDMAPCRMGPWDPQEEWVPFFRSVLQLHIHVHQRRCHFVAPMPAARVGFRSCTSLSPPSAALSTPRHEIFGPLLAPAQTCSPLL